MLYDSFGIMHCMRRSIAARRCACFTFYQSDYSTVNWNIEERRNILITAQSNINNNFSRNFKQNQISG